MKKTLGYAVLIAGLLLGSALIVFPQTVTSLAGLAVAQSSTKWNRVKDMAFGDAVSSGSLDSTPCLYNGVTCDRQRGSIANGALVDVTRIGGASTPSDAFANPTTTNVLWVLNSVLNATTWDRVREAYADALASTGIQAAGMMAFNNSTYDRARSISAGNNTATTSQGTLYVTPISTWSVINTTAGATAATASKAAGGGTVRHVATGITICFSDSVANVTARLASLRDGATGAGTILRTWILTQGVAGAAQCENLTDLNMTGSANTAMTVEFAAAPAATASETVTLTGYSTP